jgi:6-phosphogluconate dehydrogenase
MASIAPVVGLYGLAVMGQNLALNIADKGFPIAVCNRSPEKVRSVVVDEGQLIGSFCSACKYLFLRWI